MQSDFDPGFARRLVAALADEGREGVDVGRVVRTLVDETLETSASLREV